MVDTAGMKVKEMRELLKPSPDFKTQKMLEECIESRGHICVYPLQIKFNRVCLVLIQKIVPAGLNSVTVDQFICHLQTI